MVDEAALDRLADRIVAKLVPEVEALIDGALAVLAQVRQANRMAPDAQKAKRDAVRDALIAGDRPGARALMAQDQPPRRPPARRVLTHAEIDAALSLSGNGGCTRATATALGIKYPPRHGWLKRLRAEADRLGPRASPPRRPETTRARAKVDAMPDDEPFNDVVIDVLNDDRDDPPWDIG